LSYPPRIIALCGNKLKLQEALRGLAILGRRLQQASVYVVVVPTDGSKPSDWQIEKVDYKPWLADSYDLKAWQDYFDSLSSEENAPTSFRWFGLNSAGRSFGSGEEEIPSWIQLLGQHLRPTDLLDESDNFVAKGGSDSPLLGALQTFYQALTTGNQGALESVFSEAASNQVTEVRMLDYVLPLGLCLCFVSLSEPLESAGNRSWRSN
jgi:hypothetical protein